MRSLRAKKTPAEKEDEQVEQQAKPAPKLKPPRYDSRRKHIENEDDDLDKKDKDLSMNYKDIGGSETALDEAICLVAMRFRGIAPDAEDLMLIKRSLVGSVDLTNAGSYPKVANATFTILDSKYKHARLRRVRPTPDHRRFEMGAPLEPRDDTDPLWPVWSRVIPFKPALVTQEDLKAIVAEAKKRIKPDLLEYNKDVALREALDMTLGTYLHGKYQHMLDAPTYTATLVALGDEELDLTEDTYVPTQSHNPDLKYIQDKPFDPHQWWGKPAEGHIDVHKEEAWRKHFDFPGVYQRDEDEPWMERLTNPSV